MAKIIDLNLLSAEDMEFKIGEDTYTIPGHPTTKMTMKFAALQSKMSKAKKTETYMDILAEIVAFLLDQDETKEVTKEFVLNKLSVAQMQRIMSIFQETLMEINNDPN